MILLVYCQFVMDFFFFFFVLYIFVLHFFITQVIFFFKKKYYHIIIIINSKLEIGHDILKNIPSKNRSNHTLYITLKLTALHM